jgi:hypothetical protein
VGGVSVVVVVSPGYVVVVSGTVVVVVVVVVEVVVVVAFFNVVVVVRRTVVVVVRLTVGRGRGRFVETVSVTMACQATRVPGAGVWCRTTVHFPVKLPSPRVRKYSWARFMAAKVPARERPIRRGTRLGPCGAALATVSAAWECQATIVPGAGFCATTAVHVLVADPGPRVAKYSCAAFMVA